MAQQILRNEAPDWTGAKCIKPAGLPPEEYDIPFEEPEKQLAQCNGEDGLPVCPRRHECLIFALSNNIEYGVFGGMGEQDRATMRRKYPMRKKQIREEWEWREPSANQLGLYREQSQQVDLLS